jgi:hypothetical protein
MNKKEFRSLLESYGILNDEFINYSWTRMGDIAKVMEKKDLEPVLKLVMKRISKKRLKELGEKP